MLDEDKVDQSTPTETPAQGAEQQAPDSGAGDAPVKKAAAKKAAKKAPAKRTTKKVAAPPAADPAAEPGAAVAAEALTGETAAPVVKTTTRRRTTKKVAAAPPAEHSTTEQVEQAPENEPGAPAEPAAESDAPAAPAKKAAARKTTRRAPARTTVAPAATDELPTTDAPAADAPAEAAAEAAATAAASVLFQAPEPTRTPVRRTRKAAAPKVEAPVPSEDEDEDEDTTADAVGETATETATGTTTEADEASEDETEDETDEGNGEGGPARRRRRRGGRRRRKPGDGGTDTNDADDGAEDEEEPAEDETEETPADDSSESGGEGTSRRRRRRRRAGEESTDGDDDANTNTVTRVRNRRSAEDQITAVAGSTRLEAKKQRRREGREAGRRRAPIVSEAEFLARRESVDRVMVIRQRHDLTQIAVLEDKVLVEHYVARESQTSLIGNVYLGRVQNVLPSMEAAFIDIGKGRNAVLYAGEVNWSALGHKDGQPRKIESVLSSGQSVLVQVTKDPVGHKGARLTSQISLAGRFLVYVPDGTTSGISRKLPDTERNRLKSLLKEIVPDTAGVIVRTAAEGASEDELTRDVERLKARWEDIEAKARGNAPQLLYGEPDLTLKVVRDLFTEDFTRMVIEGDDAWDTVQGYVTHVAPDLEDRLERFDRGANGKDVFASYRIDEQIQKGLDRKVWLPSGGSLVIDRTEAMTVVDVNTGKFTGSGGNLEETVTKNNLEAAEEIVRQLRLRDIGGIIVVDFIDMVLESNRDLVVRRLVECLGRDRTRHQVAEVTSLGLVQMTRKRIGTGLLEAFSTDCEHCHGRGLVTTDSPVEPGKQDEDGRRGAGRRSRGRGKGDNADVGNGNHGGSAAPSPKDVAAMARAEGERKEPGADGGTDEAPAEPTGGRNRRSGRGRGGSRVGGDAVTTGEPTSTPTGVVPTDEPAVVTATDEDRHAAQAPDVSEPAAEREPVIAAEVESTEEPGELLAETVAAAGLAIDAVEPTPAVDAGTDKPQVVTRTRRRSASRPAGPPIGVAGASPETGLVEPGTADLEPGADVAAVPAYEHHVEHVPIKKKGTRKR